MKYKWNEIKAKLLVQKPLLEPNMVGMVTRIYLIVLAYYKNEKIPHVIFLDKDSGKPLVSILNDSLYDFKAPSKKQINKILKEELKQAEFRLKHIALNPNIIKIEPPKEIPTAYRDILDWWYHYE